MNYVDFRSDTVTHPTEEMRKAMFMAEVGDDVYQDDPTTNELEALAAEMLGTEAALFVPSGTMGNQLAIMSHTRRGQEIIVSENSHIFEHEVGAAAVLSGVNLRPLSFENGLYNASAIEAAIRSDDIHEPPTGLICLENALANGRVLSLEAMKEIKDVADRHGIPIHIDGARLFNAAVALNTDIRELTALVDSVSCCLSKGLCAPIGSVLCGKKDFILAARKYRKMLGGGMRQTGILAAAGIIALRDMTKRLDKDHQNARLLAKRLLDLPGVTVDMESVQINMIFANFNWRNLPQLQPWLKERGVVIANYTGPVIRFLTHNQTGALEIESLIGLLDEFRREYA